jgi:hypothetical protein
MMIRGFQERSGAKDCQLAVLQRLAPGLQGIAAELRQFVEEKGAVVGRA